MHPTGSKTAIGQLKTIYLPELTPETLFLRATGEFLDFFPWKSGFFS